ncbi:MAG: DNA mismatch repair protein MutS [Ammonifex sp.]|nr:MAG: DNA mismatch repair protein MutS [Ammonifex sp.]
MSLTPMMRQYMDIKKQYPDAILLFHLGDFYEMFAEDARTAAPVLEVTLTSREAGKLGRVPMCGVPCHSVEGYIARLVAQGFKVAICEQLEDPAQAKGLLKRGVTRVITPGTFFEGRSQDHSQNNYIISVAPSGPECYGLAAADVATGYFGATEFSGPGARERLYDELYRLQPVEAVLPGGAKELAGLVKAAAPAAVTFHPEAAFDRGTASAALEGYQLEGGRPGTQLPECRAAGALAAYLKATQMRDLAHMKAIQFYTPAGFMVLDAATRRNLELTRSLQDGSRRGTLLEVLDHTLTGMGSRRLRSWLEQPLLSPGAINERLEAVEALIADGLARDKLRAALRQIGDLERLAGRLAFGMANARDLLALRDSLQAAGALREIFAAAEGLLKALVGRLADLSDIITLIESAVAPEPPAVLDQGGIIREGFNEEVDRLRLVRRDARGFIAALEAEERVRTGIKSLKVGYNRVFGYYIEVTKSNLSLVPAEYQRRQTLAAAERFVTPALKEYEEMIFGAEERLKALEFELFSAVREEAAGAVDRILRTARAVGEMDALQSLAAAAVMGDYIRPEVNDGDTIAVREGRHPVVERFLGPGGFVPNDVVLDGASQRVAIITGPNMAGKSTFMRQVALITLMAQTGSFVPAAAAEIGVVDRIFTRIGAADNLAGGQSTFMVEMSECRTILTGATRRSLIVMDEVGRGTSTYDGMSIARAIIEYIAVHIGAKTLFSTHYHELTDLDRIGGIYNLTVAVREDPSGIVFLYRVVPGKADKSYGIQVAALAGLPEETLQRARQVLAELEARTAQRVKVVQLEMFPQPGENPILDEIRGLDTDNLTPLDALNRLVKFKSLVTNTKPQRRRGRQGGH